MNLHPFIPLLLILFLSADGRPAHGAEVSDLSRGKQWGVYQIRWNPSSFEEGLENQIKMLGAKPDFVLFFRDLHAGRGFPLATVEICREQAVVPVISKELWVWGHSKKQQSWLPRIIEGELDDYWKKWATDAKSFGDPVILRFGFEMNGDWFSWGQQPQAFIDAWRHVYAIVREEVGADNVNFMFSPNVMWNDPNPLIEISQYYPGSEYVDTIGLDGYNFGDSFSQWHAWQTFDQVFEKSLNLIAGYEKPIYLAEMGCADGPQKAEWIRDFFESLENDDRISGFIYYNHSDGKNNEPNWRFDSDDETLELAKERLGQL